MAIADAVEERLAELAALDADWDADMFCQHSDPSSPHYLPSSGPVQQTTLTHARMLIGAVGHEPYSIMPISASPDSGAWVMVEWHGPLDHISIEVGPDGVDSWLLIVGANDQPTRRFYESKHAELAEMVCYAQTVMTPR